MSRVTVTDPTVGGNDGTWGGINNTNLDALAAAVNALGTAADHNIAEFATGLTDAGVKTTTYTATANQIVRCDATSGGFTVTLPTAPADGTRMVVKKIDSSANVVTVSRGGTDVFNKTGGSTTIALSYQFASLALQYVATGAIWVVVSTDLGTGYVTPTDSRLTDARTPTAHASSHAPAGSDDLTTALSATSVPVALGTAAVGGGTGFARQGHVHPTTGLVLPARLVSTGYGLTGGGDLSADRTHAVALTTDSGSLSADVSLNATTLTTLFTTASLAAGTWVIFAPVTLLGGAATAAIDISVATGTATTTFAGPSSVTARTAVTTVTSATFVACAVITVAGTLVISAYATTATTAKKLGTANSTPAATGYIAFRIA